MLTETHTGCEGGMSGESFSPLAAVHKAHSEAALGQVFGRPSWIQLSRGAWQAMGDCPAKRPIETRTEGAPREVLHGRMRISHGDIAAPIAVFFFFSRSTHGSRLKSIWISCYEKKAKLFLAE